LSGIKKSNPLEKEDIMKKLMVVLSVIFLIIAAAGTGILSWRDFGDGADLAKIEKEMDKASTQSGVGKAVFKQALKEKGLDVSASKFTFAGIVTALTFLVCLAAFILVFMKKPNISVYAGIVLIIFSIIMILVNPVYDTGPFGPTPARTLAIIFGAVAILGAIFSMTLAKMRQKSA
jgi:magnesium-transporting ATPase (P-type)